MAKSLDWKVKLPKGRWMAGYLHSFATMAQAEDFITRWNAAEATMNRASVTFERDGYTFQPAFGPGLTREGESA